jgi:hypothetical protein
MNNIVHTCKVPVAICLDTDTLIRVTRKINKALTGQLFVNEYDENRKIVRRKDISPETHTILADAHHAINGSLVIHVTFDVTDHGEFINFRVPNEIS